MIEKLYPEEYPFGEPKYSALEKRAEALRASLYARLDQDGTDRLGELDRIFHAQCDAALRDSFALGFRTAMELISDLREGRLP